MATRPYPAWLGKAILYLALLLQWPPIKASVPSTTAVGNPIATEYRWSAWTEYSTCTRSCGIGIKVRQRACFRFGQEPEQVDIAYCGGVSKEAKTCNTQPCPRGARDFRSLQCSFFNGKKHGGTDHHAWVPYRAAKFRRNTKIKSCALACTPHGRGHFVVQFSPHVVDGTECRENPHSVCVAGRCMAVGCDNELQSRARVDWCGVCGGDNSSCETLSGNIARNLTVGYGELLTIPRGARHIKIVERDSREVVLALRNTQGIFFFNGHLETRYSTITRLVAGTVFYYQHPLFDALGMETFQAEGPVSEDLVVMGHTQQDISSVEILFEYTVLKNRSARQEYNTHTNMREKSLPWEAILYEKLHPGYNIGAVGSAYVKRKKERDGSAFRSRVPPWQPPEPRLVPSPRLPGQRFLPETTPKEEKAQFHAQPTSLPPRAKPLTSSPWLHTDRRAGHLAQPPSTEKPRNTERTPSLPGILPQKFDDSFRAQRRRQRGQETSDKDRVTRLPPEKHWSETTFEITKYTSVSENASTTTASERGSQFSLSYGETSLEPSEAKYPVTDKMPVFIPAEEEDEDLGFRMTEDLIGSNYESDTLDNFTSKDVYHSMYDINGDLHLGRERPASFLEGGPVGRSGGYVPPYDRPDSQFGPRGPRDPRYGWRPKTITPCSSTCAPGGVQFEFFECHRVIDGLMVLDSYCDERDKPDPRYHQCTSQQCVARWVTGIWSHCSRSCGDGQTFRSVRCWRMLAPGFDSTVHADQCKSYQKPESTSKCNEGACGPQWQFSAWGKCSAECGRGHQRRIVRCNTGDVRDCQKSPRPADRRTCGSVTCDNYWKTTKWSRCSGPCGSGVRQRQVLCRSARGRALDERSCDRNTKPLSVQACGDKDYCQFVWVPQRWEKCTAECGEGTADRKVVCGAVSNGLFQVHPDSYCHRMSKPMTTARCREMPCEPKWLTTEWSKCSKSCGKGGIKMREVRCYHDNEESNGCENNRKPKAVEKCPLPACAEERRGPPCADDKKRINCDLVLKVQLCHHWYYKTACCKSCIEANRRQREKSADAG